MPKHISICILVSGPPNTQSAVVWKMVPLFLYGFCGGKGTIGVLKVARGLRRKQSLFFQHFVSLAAAYVSHLMISYFDFLILFAPTN
jgi:hypothetical protein